MYRPKMIKGMVNGTGYPIDGHVLYLTLWDYDFHAKYHLSNWDDADDEAVMKTMFLTECRAGVCVVDALEEFKQQWENDEWEPDGAFCIPLNTVEVIETIYEEDKNYKLPGQQEES